MISGKGEKVAVLISDYCDKQMGPWSHQFPPPRRPLFCLALFGVAAFVAILDVDIATQQQFFIRQYQLMNNVRVGDEKSGALMLRGSLNQTQMPLPTDSGLEVAEKNGANEKEGVKEKSESPRIAICVVGGARRFELTGPSLLKYVLNKYNNSDVFLHAPFDGDSHKFSLLKDVSSLAAVRIFIPERIEITALHKDVLTSVGSPGGLQGLLQYFNLVEGCLTMIKAQQSRHNVEYDWVVRTRVDGYWNGPLPPPQSFSPDHYIVPPGSAFRGLNDRLGIGNFATSEVALSRISLLPLLRSSGYRRLNSETAFMHQLDVKGVEYEFRDFPFCIMSMRRYGWPLSRRGVPVVSISSKGNMNGAKCRPCKPGANASEARGIIESLARHIGWTPASDGLELCNARRGWDEHWEEIFDEVAGSEFAAARKKIKFRSVVDCVNDFEVMKQKTGYWEAPSLTTICEKAS